MKLEMKWIDKVAGKIGDRVLHIYGEVNSLVTKIKTSAATRKRF
jgi:hypothetical protein